MLLVNDNQFSTMFTVEDKSMSMKVVFSKEVPELEQQIKVAREKSSLSITKLSAAANMTVSNWYRIESGKQSVPIETLQQIESALGVDFGVKL